MFFPIIITLKKKVISSTITSDQVINSLTIHHEHGFEKEQPLHH
jgi:hypothetical protein